jgi:RimJ/RimL family protein N-acetyltransferase
MYNMNLNSNRLIFKHYTKIDFNDFKAILMDDEIMKHISGKGNSEKVTKNKFKKVLKTNSENNNLGFFNITLKETKHLVGFAKLVAMDDSLEIGYALLKKQWGKGFASEITKNLIIHAKNHFPEKEIIAIVNLGNDASKNVLIKQQFIKYNTGILDGFEVEYFKLAH